MQWTATLPPVSPSGDTVDGRVHFTPGNLVNKFHRSIEHETTGPFYKHFKDDKHFAINARITMLITWCEGAANISRFCTIWEQGIEFFVLWMEASTTAVLASQNSCSSHLRSIASGCPSSWIISGPKWLRPQNPAVIDVSVVFHNER